MSYWEAFVKKLKILALLVTLVALRSVAFAQDDETVFPESDGETIIPPPIPPQENTPPVIIDDESSDVQDVDEYDG